MAEDDAAPPAPPGRIGGLGSAASTVSGRTTAVRFFESFQGSSEELKLQYNKPFHQMDPREFTDHAMWEKLAHYAVFVHENDRSGKPLVMSTAIGYMRSLLQQALRICDRRTDIE